MTVTADRIHLGGDAWCAPDLEPLLCDIAAVTPHPENPRNGDTDAIVESIRIDGLYRPVYAQRSTGHILAGNHTTAATMELGGERIPVVWLDVDDSAARRILIKDNAIADLGRYDEGLLLQSLTDLRDEVGLMGTGHTEESYAVLAAAVAAHNEEEVVGLTDADDAPPLREETVSHLGDLWQLGPHRLVCGDATDPAVVARLMDGGSERATAIWTDPPYGIDYVGKTKDALRIQNDGRDTSGLANLLRDAVGAAMTVSEPGGPVYMTGPPGPAGLIFYEVLSELRILRQVLVWVKDGFVLGRSDYHYQHEPIFSGYLPGGEGRRGRGGSAWVGPNNCSSVMEELRPRASREHPTMKPVGLVARCLRNHRPGVVLDFFAGSGSTLLAAEHLPGWTARLVEVDPRYADVICRRYQQHTGHLPVRDGQSHDFTTE